MAITVAYTQLGKARKDESGYRHFNFKLVFGDGVQTYGTGVQLSFAKLGCPNELKQLGIVGLNSGFDYKFDPATGILHIYQVPDATSLAAAAPMVELAAGATPAADTVYVEVVGY